MAIIWVSSQNHFAWYDNCVHFDFGDVNDSFEYDGNFNDDDDNVDDFDDDDGNGDDFDDEHPVLRLAVGPWQSDDQ